MVDLLKNAKKLLANVQPKDGEGFVSMGFIRNLLEICNEPDTNKDEILLKAGYMVARNSKGKKNSPLPKFFFNFVEVLKELKSIDEAVELVENLVYVYTIKRELGDLEWLRA